MDALCIVKAQLITNGLIYRVNLYDYNTTTHTYSAGI